MNISRMHFRAVAATIGVAVAAHLYAAASQTEVPPKWISGDSAEPEKPAPMLIKEFKIDALPAQAVFSVAVAGWCENSVETYPA